jgi:hypothetical protein
MQISQPHILDPYVFLSTLFPHCDSPNVTPIKNTKKEIFVFLTLWFHISKRKTEELSKELDK